MRQIQIADVFDGPFQMNFENIANLLAESLTVKKQRANVHLSFIVYNDKATARCEGIGMHVSKSTDLAPDGFYCVIVGGVCPDRRPIRSRRDSS